MPAVAGQARGAATGAVDLVHDLVHIMGMSIVNIHEAKTHLSRLLERVAAGEEITIAKANRPIARLVPIHQPTRERVPGTGIGELWIADDFNAPLPAELLDRQDGEDLP